MAVIRAVQWSRTCFLFRSLAPLLAADFDHETLPARDIAPADSQDRRRCPASVHHPRHQPRVDFRRKVSKWIAFTAMHPDRRIISSGWIGDENERVPREQVVEISGALAEYRPVHGRSEGRRLLRAIWRGRDHPAWFSRKQGVDSLNLLGCLTPLNAPHRRLVAAMSSAALQEQEAGRPTSGCRCTGVPEKRNPLSEGGY